jgi:hypothetical protein
MHPAGDPAARLDQFLDRHVDGVVARCITNRDAANGVSVERLKR